MQRSHAARSAGKPHRAGRTCSPGVPSASCAVAAAAAYRLNDGMADPRPRRIRIGIDTGGTFTDVVALDEDTGELVTTKTPSTPANPADGFLAGIDKVLGLLGCRPAGTRSPRSATAPPSPPTSCSRARSDRLGFVTTEGYDAMLEIARQSVPDGYGNSYFWVKPRPDRAARPGRARSAAGSTSPAPRCGPSTRTAPARSPAGSATAASTPSASASCTPTPTPRTRSGCARSSPRSTPTRSCQHQQRGAARVPRVRAGDDHARRRRGQAPALGVRREHQRPAGGVRRRTRSRVPFYVMKSNGGVLSADEVVHQPITTVLSGPAAGALGRGADRAGGRLRPGADLRRRRHVDRRLGGRRRRADADHRGLGRRVPEQDPDDRRGDRRRRRRLDRLAVAGGRAQGRARSRRAPTPARSATPRAAPTSRSPTPTWCSAGSRPHLLGGEIPLDVDAARAGRRARWPASSG